MSDLTFILEFSSNVAMETNFGAESAKLAYPFVLTFQNRLENCNAGVKKLTGDDPFTSGRNLLSFRPVTCLILAFICHVIFEQIKYECIRIFT